MASGTYKLQLGRMTITVMSEGTMVATARKMFHRVKSTEWSPFVETDDAGRMTYGLGEPHPSRASFDRAFPITQTGTAESCVQSIGVAPDEITKVVLSHAHADHIMGSTVEREGDRIPVFPNARHILMEVEWKKAPARMMRRVTMFKLHLPVLQAYGLLDLVPDQFEVVRGIRMIIAPGESPGHAIIRMEDAGQVVYYVADLLNHPVEVARPQWVAPGRDQPSMLQSRRALLDTALREDAILISSHIEFPGIGKVRTRGDTYEWVPIA
jgi:glyoxylase-like metal-dependent hydrolase (beta-lactamase superfamily II)